MSYDAVFKIDASLGVESGAYWNMPVPIPTTVVPQVSFRLDFPDTPGLLLGAAAPFGTNFQRNFIGWKLHGGASQLFWGDMYEKNARVELVGILGKAAQIADYLASQESFNNVYGGVQANVRYDASTQSGLHWFLKGYAGVTVNEWQHSSKLEVLEGKNGIGLAAGIAFGFSVEQPEFINRQPLPDNDYGVGRLTKGGLLIVRKVRPGFVIAKDEEDRRFHVHYGGDKPVKSELRIRNPAVNRLIRQALMALSKQSQEAISVDGSILFTLKRDGTILKIEIDEDKLSIQPEELRSRIENILVGALLQKAMWLIDDSEGKTQIRLYFQLKTIPKHTPYPGEETLTAQAYTTKR